MPHDNAADPGAKTEIVEQSPADNTASTATTTETETQTTSTSSLMERLGIPAEAQQELKELQPAQEPEAEPAAQVEVTAEEPEAEPTAEQPETPEAESETEIVEGEELPKPNKNWPPEVQDEFRRRVGKEAGKRRRANEKVEKLEEQLERVTAQLEATQPVTVAPNQSDLLADVTNEQQLEEKVHYAKVARDWCRAHPTGFTENEGKENERFIPPEEIAVALGRAEDVIQEYAPKKRAELQQRGQFDGIARKIYPTLFDRTSEDYIVANSVLQQIPSLATRPDRNIVIGDYLRGVRARLAEQTSQVNGKKPHPAIPEALTRPQPPIAPHVPAASRSNGSQPSPRKKVDQAMNHVAEGGGREAIVEAIRAKREAAAATTNSRSPVLV